MSVSHGRSTIGGIEYGGGCEEKTKKEEVSHKLGKLMMETMIPPQVGMRLQTMREKIYKNKKRNRKKERKKGK